ncbi:N-acetylglucosamine-6-phosphate deacetylase [Acetobacter sp. AN02]|uniref:N-acetylglucosamine-6-phosphate deacetylase n=1 Tax=Acetobacter sp. AN02 TaxID=2894186 RepID=UPI0024346753|nr:N-acetylglucosamine-6-phosphate deacetylase [Acetobacter sp. AN02]MDG6094724.1 N-acetylglucosamine-6-phosphate deacetylase [Acetobacter sp. AN02]
MQLSGQLSGKIVLPDQVITGELTLSDGLIRSIRPLHDAPPQIILPGFIDCHVHGGDGADTMDGVEAIHRLSRFHLTHGTTTLLPTTITRPWKDVTDALRAIAEARENRRADGPELHGAHLEGPFVSPLRLGAQPPFAILPTPEKITEVLDTGIVRIVTIAPELEHADTAIARFAAADVRVSIGHTTAGYEETEAAICRICSAGGTAGGTHLFNAMPPVESRRPGPATALMCSDAGYAEMILDLHHIHPATFRLTSRMMRDRLLLITDCMRGAGQPEGPSQLGGQDVMIRNGAARLPDGTLAGSVLTLDTAFRNAVREGGKSLPEAAALTATNAARYLGLHDRGRITPGLRADLVVMDEALQVRDVIIAGRSRI